MKYKSYIIRQILRTISKKSKYKVEISQEVDISLPTMRKYLKMLQKGGYIKKKIMGIRHYYYIKKMR